MEKRTIRICLYTCIPQNKQSRRQYYPFREKLKSVLKNTANEFYSSLTGELRFEVYSYMVAKGLGDNSNRGDIAIRLAIQSQLQSAFSGFSVEFFEIGWGDLTDENIDYINQNTDLFVITGGGYIFVNGDGSPGAMLADSAKLAKLKCPVVALGIGLNRLMHEQVVPLSELPSQTQERVNQLGSICQRISVRDRDTAELFERYGERLVTVTGDPVLYFSEDEPSPFPELGSLKIGVNLAAHGWRAYSVLAPILPDIVSSLIEIQNGRGAEITYFMHHDFEWPVIKHLEKKGLLLNVVRSSAPDLIDAYRRVDFVINQMLHSCIFAANAGIPFINLAYDRKSLAFCSLLEISECAIEHSKVTRESLFEKFEYVLKNRKVLSETIISNRNRLRFENQAFLKEVVKLLVETEDVRARI